MFYQMETQDYLLNPDHIVSITDTEIQLPKVCLVTTREETTALREFISAAGLLPKGFAHPLIQGEPAQKSASHHTSLPYEMTKGEFVGLNEEISAVNGRLNLHGQRFEALKETLDQMAPPAVQTCNRSAGHAGPCNGYPGFQCYKLTNDPEALFCACAMGHTGPCASNRPDPLAEAMANTAAAAREYAKHFPEEEFDTTAQSEFHINVEKSFDEVNEKLIRILARLDEPQQTMRGPQNYHVNIDTSLADFHESVTPLLPDSLIADAFTNFITPLIQNIESAKRGYLDLSDSTLLHSLEAWHSVLLKLKAHLTTVTPRQYSYGGFTWTMPASEDMLKDYEESFGPSPAITSNKVAEQFAATAIRNEFTYNAAGEVVGVTTHYPSYEIYKEAQAKQALSTVSRPDLALKLSTEDEINYDDAGSIASPTNDEVADLFEGKQVSKAVCGHYFAANESRCGKPRGHKGYCTA